MGNGRAESDEVRVDVDRLDSIDSLAELESSAKGSIASVIGFGRSLVERAVGGAIDSSTTVLLSMGGLRGDSRFSWGLWSRLARGLVIPLAGLAVRVGTIEEPADRSPVFPWARWALALASFSLRRS